MHQPVKLAIVGASSTGKTTLWEKLQEAYRSRTDVLFVHESAREFFLANPAEISFGFNTQKKILELARYNEKQAHEKHPRLIITDTSAIEVVLYTKVSGDEEGAKKLLEEIRPWMKTYTKFLLLNPEDVLFENDEIRIETKETRDKIHALMVDFYHKERLPFTLISGTIPERQKRISDIMQTYL